jgi:hypothetical protein
MAGQDAGENRTSTLKHIEKTIRTEFRTPPIALTKAASRSMNRQWQREPNTPAAASAVRSATRPKANHSTPATATAKIAAKRQARVSSPSWVSRAAPCGSPVDLNPSPPRPRTATTPCAIHVPFAPASSSAENSVNPDRSRSTRAPSTTRHPSTQPSRFSPKIVPHGLSSRPTSKFSSGRIECLIPRIDPPDMPVGPPVNHIQDA